MDGFPRAQVSTVMLSAAENRKIMSLVARFGDLDPVTAAGAYVLEAQLLSAGLPDSLRRELLGFRVDGSRLGGLLVRNLPVEPLPATPRHADDGVGIYLNAAKCMSIIVAALGEQFGFRPELGGRIIQDILPVPGFEDTQQSISSRALLELHCETVFTDARADFVGLLCLRPDHERHAATLLSPAVSVLAKLDQATIDVLKQPRFSTTVDGSFLRGSGLDQAVVVQPVTILAGSDEYPRLRCDFAETKGLDAVAQKAVDALYQAACDVAMGVYLEAGDLLIVDNHSTFHGRTSFSMRGDGMDRWLLRSFVARDLSRSIGSRLGGRRIVDIDYSFLARQLRELATNGGLESHGKDQELAGNTFGWGDGVA
jgi:L-asparagine oxygenase